jgi:hypothetical protein
MTSYLMLTVYETASELNTSDQITVPADVWTALDEGHDGAGPIFVEVGGVGSGVVGRLRPAFPSEVLSGDSCRLPQWMWMRLGAPAGTDDDCWIELTRILLPIATSVTLRARTEASITGVADPVAMLTEALSGVTGLSWACLSVGAELPLSCGVFDIIEIRSTVGTVVVTTVPYACILNCDVNLELVPALDHRPPSPPSPPSPFQEEEEPSAGKKGFIPFSGLGRRLCDS